MCIGIIKSDAWKPSTKVAASTHTIVRTDTAVIEAILLLLREPNPDDALMSAIGTPV